MRDKINKNKNKIKHQDSSIKRKMMHVKRLWIDKAVQKEYQIIKISISSNILIGIAIVVVVV